MSMKRNEGTIDRVIRTVLAVVAAIAAVAIGSGSLWGVLLLAVAAILLVTAAVSFCPLYAILGIGTCPVPRAHESRQRAGTAS